MGESIVQRERECWFCGKTVGLELHHILAGTANRRVSEQYGLTVWLCHDCHTGRNGAQYDPVKGLELKQAAQKAFQDYYGRSMWMKLFRKNYL